MAGVCLFLLLAVGVVFGQAAGFGFVNLDDNIYVYSNEKIIRGFNLGRVAWAWTHVVCNFYSPLTVLSLMLDNQLHGLHAGGYHLTNILLHGASVVLLFLILREMTGGFWRSAFVAALFAVHPLRVESVAWISERKDVLGTFFFMLTLWAYVRYVRKPGAAGRYWSVAGFFALDLLCKPTALTLPFVLLLLDYWPLRRLATGNEKTKKAAATEAALPFWELAREKIPLMVLAGVVSVVTYFAQGKAVVPVAQLPLLARIGNAFISYVVYLRQVLWPSGLAIFYPYPENSNLWWEAALAFLLLTAVTVLVLGMWRKRPWLMVGWFWYLGMLVPMIGLVAVNPSAHADRNTYLPQIGLTLALTWAAADWAAGWKWRRWALGGAMAVVTIALMICSWRQTLYWRDSETLWKRALACTPSYSDGHNNLGEAYYQKGGLEAAIAEYRRAMEIAPGNTEALNNLGYALFSEGKLDEAIAQYQNVLKLNPNLAAARSNLGLAYSRKGDQDQAIAQYREVLKITPEDATAYNNLGLALGKKGLLAEAIAQYRKAVEIDPDYAESHSNLGATLAAKGDADGAIAEYRKALKIDPDLTEAHFNLGVALSERREWEEAIAQYRQALDRAPDYAEIIRLKLCQALLDKGDLTGAMATLEKSDLANPDWMAVLYNLGNGFLQKGDLDKAVACYQKLLKRNPRSADAQANLGMALLGKGETRQAMDCWRQALEINPNQVYVLNNLAWLLAAAPDPTLRNGAKAVALAAQANELSGHSNPSILHTLAAAYSEQGSYALAAAAARHGLELAEAQTNSALAATLRKEIKLYEAGTPAQGTPH